MPTVPLSVIDSIRIQKRRMEVAGMVAAFSPLPATRPPAPPDKWTEGVKAVLANLAPPWEPVQSNNQQEEASNAE